MTEKNLNEKKIIVIGTGGSGKTEFAKKLWKDFKCPMAYDINRDFEKCSGGIVYYPADIKGEFIPFLKHYLDMTKKIKIDALFFDDADGYIDYELMNEPLFLDLVIRCRNEYKVSLVFICKRPQNIPTKIMEGNNLMFIFKTEGVNAVNRLCDIDKKIAPMLEQIYEHDFSYIVKWEGLPPEFKKPIKL